jgi:hypothetical protein
LYSKNRWLFKWLSVKVKLKAGPPPARPVSPAWMFRLFKILDRISLYYEI